MDLALGQFADAHLTELDDAEIAEFERWLDLPDPDILAWITGEAPTPAEIRHAAVRAAARGASGSAAPGEIGLVNAPVALAHRLRRGGAVTLARAPEGFDAFVVADLARALAREAESRAVALTFVARDSLRAQSFIDALAFAAPEIEALYLPAWDCQPYDRVSPNAAIAAQRMTALARLALTRGAMERPRVLVATVNAMTQRVPPQGVRRVGGFFGGARQQRATWRISRSGWNPTASRARAVVRDVGDYAQRGGILDLYAPGAPAPVRLDFFGDTLESIRSFDPETQRSVGQLRALDLVPMSEAQLTTETIRRFRQGYAAEFGAPRRGDSLYEAVSEGRRAIGLEHWLPLFYERLDTLFDYVARRAGRARRARRGGRRRALRADRGLLCRAQDRQRSGPGARRLSAAEAGPALSRRPTNGASGSRPARSRG